MKKDLNNFAKIGLVHHMLYSDILKDPDLHARTLTKFTKRPDISTFDCCVPYGTKRRSFVIDAINSSEKEVTYSLHLYPFYKMPLTSPDPQEKAQARLIVKDQINMAVALGANNFIFASGPDHILNEGEEGRIIFSDFCRWLCNELAPYEITALIEPFDKTFDKKFLYGTTIECVELIKSLKPEISNLGIELDIAHLPLLGENFKHAFKIVKPYLKRVHLGNCLINDKNHPWYGDKHPPIGYKGGEIGVSEIKEVLKIALDIGYLSRKERGSLILEMQPYPDKTIEETIKDNLEKLKTAWKSI